MALTDEQRKRYDDYFAAPVPQQQNANNAAPAAPAQPTQMSQADAEYNAYLASKGMAPEPTAQPTASQEDGFLGSAAKGFKSGVAGVAGGLAGLAGKNAVTDYFDDVEQSNRRAKDFDSVFSWDYITDPSGLTYDVANQAGSMAGLGVATKAALALAPGAVVAAPALKLLTTARKLGTPGRWVAKKLGKEGMTNLVEGAFTAIPEAFSEGGQTIKELDEQGDPDKYWKGAGVIGKNLALLPLTNAIEWGAVTGGLKGAMGKAGESIVTRVAKAPFRAAGPAVASSLMNGIEEFEQTTFSNQAAGKDQSVLDLFQPSKWDDERRQAFEVGALGSLVMAGVPGMARSAQIEQQKQNGRENLSDYEKLVAQVADETIQKNRAINEVLGSSDRFSNIRFNEADEELTAEFERRGGRIVPNGVIYRDGTLYKGSDYGVNWYENFEEMSADELEEWKNDRLEDLADTANMPELQGNYFFSNNANAEYLQHIDQLIAMKRQKEAKEGKKAEEKPATNGAVPPSAPPAPPRPKEVQDSPLGRSPQDQAMPQEYTDAMEAEQAAQTENAPEQQAAPQIKVPQNLLDLGYRGLVGGDRDALTTFGYLRPEMQQAIRDAIHNQLLDEAMQGQRGNTAAKPKGQASAPQEQNPVQNPTAAPQQAPQQTADVNQAPTAQQEAPVQQGAQPQTAAQPAATPVTGETGTTGVVMEPKRNPATAQQPATSGQAQGQQTAEGGVQNENPEVSKPETGEGGNQDVNAQPGQTGPQEAQTGESGQNQNEAEVTGKPAETAQPEARPATETAAPAKPAQKPVEAEAPAEGKPTEAGTQQGETATAPAETAENPAEAQGQQEEETAAEDESTRNNYETAHFTANTFTHTKTKEELPRAALRVRITDDQFKEVRKIAKNHGGYYNAKIAKGFLFKGERNTERRNKFIQDAEDYLRSQNEGVVAEAPQETTTAPAPSETAPATTPAATPAVNPATAPETTTEAKPESKPVVQEEPKAEPKAEPKTEEGKPAEEAKPAAEQQEETNGFDEQAGQDELDALLGVENAEPYDPVQAEAEANSETIAQNSAFSDVSPTRVQELLNGIKNSGTLAKIVSSKETNTGTKPEAAPKFNAPLMTQLLEIGGYYVNNGKNNYAAFEKQLLSDLGENVRPYIKAVWEMIKAFPQDRKFDPKVMVACMNYVGGKLQKGADFDAVSKEFIHRYGEKNEPLLKVARLGYNNFMGIETKSTIQGMPEGTVAGAEPEMYEPDPREMNPIGAYNPWIVENPDTGELLPAAKNPEGLARTAEEFRVIAGMVRMYDGIYVEEERAIVFPAPTWRLAMRNRNEFLADANDYIGARLIEQEEEGANEDAIGEGVQGVAEGNPQGTVQPDGESGDTGQALPGTSGEGEGVSVPGTGQPDDTSGTAGGTGEDVSGEPGNSHGDTAAGGGDGEGVSIRNGLKVESMLDSDQTEVPGNDFLVPADKDAQYQTANVAKRAENNVNALRMLMQIEAENRVATPSEQAVLAQYTGWEDMDFFFYNDIAEDDIQDLMDRYEGLTEDDVYSLIDQQKELKKLLGYDEKESKYSEKNDKYYKAANSAREANTVLPNEVTRAVWDMLGDLGFKGGRILAPNMHYGEIIATMPAEVRARSAISGMDPDSLNARLAKQLYQKAYVQEGRFKHTAMPKNFFDLTAYTFSESRIDADELAKVFDSTREDGVVVITAPSNFMDETISYGKIKSELERKANLLGAIRIPEGMKIGEAGKKTGATQDILIFQKHTLKGKEKYENYFDTTNAKEYLQETKGSSPVNFSRYATINNYMAHNNAVMAGELSTKYEYSSKAELKATDDSFEQVKSGLKDIKNVIIGTLNKKLYEEPAYQKESNAPAASQTYLQNIGNRAGSFVLFNQDGKGEKVGYMDEGEFVPIAAKNQEAAKAYVGLRDETKKYLQAQLSEDITDEELTKRREELKSLYEDFVKKHGYVNDKANVKIFMSDPDYRYVLGLEKYQSDILTGEVTASPSDILTRRTVDPLAQRKAPETVDEAVAQSLDRRGIVDIDWMAEVLGKTPKELVKEIEGTLIFRNPETQQYELAEDYLSGNVGAKIELAEQAAKQVNPIYQKNVDALKKVQVKPITDPTSRDEYVTARIGSTWIPAEEYVQFINSKFNEYQDVFAIHFVPQTGDWIVNWTPYGYQNYHSREQDIKNGNYNQITYEVLGTKKHDAREILLYALQQQTKFTFKKTDDKGKATKELDTDEIRLVKSKIEHLQDEFQKWIWKDEGRTAKLMDYYNRTFRDWTLRDWVGSGENITLPGYDNSPNKVLRSHQKDGIARIAFSPYNTYLAHCVGAGKTWTMQAAMMKMKELGLAKKGIFVEPNNVVLQFAEDFYKIFPNAKILVLDSGSVPAPKVMDVKVAEAIDAAIESGDKELAKTLQQQFEAERAAVNKKRKQILERIANEDWDAVITSPEMFQRMNLSLAGALQDSEERLDELQRALDSVPSDWFETAKDKSSFENKLLKEMRAIIKSELKAIEKADPTLKSEFHDKFWQMIPKRPMEPLGPKNQRTRFSALSVQYLREEVAEYLDRAAEIDKNSLVIPFEELGFDRLFVDEADMYKNLGFATKMGDIGGLNASSDSQRAQDMYKKMHYITRLNNGKGVIAASGTPVSNTLGEMFITNIQLDYDGSNQKDVAQFDLWAPTFAKHEPVVEKKPDGNGWRMAERFTSFVNAGEMLRMFRKYADVKMADELDLPKPKLKGGERIVIKVPMNEKLDEYIHNDILRRSEAIKDGSPLSEKDNMLLITTDLRKASLDMRLVNPKIKGELVNQKIIAAADQIYHDYVESNETKGAQSVFLDLSVPKNKIEGGESETSTSNDFDFLNDQEEAEANKNFSVYQELKDMLIARGIPEEEIAFAQDAKNKDELQRMFEKVNQGQIRVIIGSTPKMGAGSNFQQRLYSQHHLDCPWKPRDMEQRDGRILRQGNMYDEVRVYTYVTEGSFDENMWGTVKRKATMINQAMSGELNQRTIEDVDAVALDYATIQAIASGNPLVAEYTVDSARLQKRQSQLNDWEASQRAAKKGLTQVQKELEPILSKINNIQKDLDAKQDLTGDKFKITIEGKEYTDKKKAEEAFNKIVERFNGTNQYNPEIVGEISGLKIGLITNWAYKADEKSGHNVATKENTVYLIGNFRYEGGTNGFGSLMNLYQTGMKKRLDDAETLRNAKEAQKKTYEDELSRPFEFQAEYDELLKKVDNEERQLKLGKYAEGENQEAEADPMQEIRDQLNAELQSAMSGQEKTAEIHAQIFERHKAKDPMARREIDDLIGEAKAAFPGAKDVRYTGDTISFTMPNGRRVKVVLKDHVIVSGEEAKSARSAHGLQGNGEALEVQGYSKRIGESSLIVMSEYSTAGNLFHEAFHTVWDLALTDKEKAALTKYYKGKTVGGENVQETMANAYRDWLIKRREQRGTLFGKLWQKILDFVDGALDFLTSVKGTENVFRQIESGKIWNRQGRYSKGAIGKWSRNYVVGGEHAATANKEILAKAKQMYAEGYTDQEIWDATKKLGQGWWIGVDGHWRFEIPDKYSMIRTKELPANGESKTYKEVYNNQALYDAYPSLAGKKVTGVREVKGSYGGTDDYGNVVLNVNYYGKNASQKDRFENYNTMFHEGQHAIQQIEGFAVGGNPASVFKAMEAEINKLTAAAGGVHPAASEYYRRLMEYDNAFYENDAKKIKEAKEDLEIFNRRNPDMTREQKKRVETFIGRVVKLQYLLKKYQNKKGFFTSGDFEAYQKLGGEEEARWVEKRAALRFGYLKAYKNKGEDILMKNVPKTQPRDSIILFDGPNMEKGASKVQASLAKNATPGIKRSVDDIEAEVKKAFPGAKDFKRKGQHITFTMPNGVGIAVDIENNLMVPAEDAERVRKEHGKDATEPIRANGYTETFSRSAAIKLAQNGDKGTTFHESYHAAWNMVLNKKEKAAMLKHYEPIAKELGKSVDEVMADAYRDWQLARQQHKGTIFGKLHQKIKDFAKKALAILTGIENAHNVMRKIAEGKVWNREVPVKLAAGYKTESGMSLKEANRFEFIIRPDGSKDFGSFDKSVEEATNGMVRAVPIRVQVGFNNEKDEGFGIIHVKKREDALQKLGYENAEDFIESIIKNYQKIYTDPKAKNRIKLIMKNDKFNVMPLDIVLVKEKGGYYTVVSAVPKNLKREEKEKGTLIYDRSASLSSATSSGPAQNRGDGQIAGTVPQSATDKSNVPFGDNNISQNEQKSNRQYSISSAIDTGLNKAESYVNRNVRKPNAKTAEGRTAAIFNNTHNKNDAQTWVAWLKNKKDKFYREWVDKNDALHQLDDFLEKAGGKKLNESEKIYNQVQVARALSNGAAQTLVSGNEQSFRALRDRIGSNVDPKDAEAMARVKQLKSGFKAMSMEDVLRPIMSKEMDKKHPDYLAKHGLNTWRDAFSNYLGARRVLELLRIAQDKGITDYALPKGITEADLKAVVEHAPAEFKQAAQRYYQLQRNMLILMEDGGLISKEVHDKINEMYHEYCPLMIDYSDTASLDSMLNNFARGADSIANVNSMLKYVLQEGSERGLISPLESTYAGINMLTDRAERNKVANHFVKMVEGNEDLQNSGILKRIEDKHGSDPKNCIFTVLIDGQKQAFQTTQDMYGPIVGFDTPAAGLAESLARNSAQILRAGATSSPSFIVRNFIRDTIFAGVSSRNGFVPIIDSFNGMWAYLHDKELRGEFDAMGITAFNFFGSGKAAVKSMDELMGDGKIHNFFDLVKAFFGKWQEASEIVEASTRMGEYMKARAAGKSMEEAALDARDVTLDFSRSGTSGRRMNMMVPFFNAAIQGGDKMYRLLAHKDPKVRMHTMRMLGLYIMLPSLLLWAFNHDEPWYEELDPHIKMNNWILPGGIRIPKPQEAGVAFGSGLEAIMDKLSGKDPAAMKEWTKALKDVMLPNLIPTLILPLMEWQANYSYFREKAIEGKRLQRLPVEQRYNSGTSELSKAIGSAAGVSPVKLDNTLRGYTGTMGMLFAQIPDMFFESKRNLPSKPLTEKAFVRDFFLNDMNMNRTSEDFYDLVSAAQQQHAGYGKKGKPTAAVTAVNKALRDVSKQQKDIQTITNAKNLSSDRKRELIDKKRAMIRQIQKATLNKYRDKFKV